MPFNSSFSLENAWAISVVLLADGARWHLQFTICIHPGQCVCNDIVRAFHVHICWPILLQKESPSHDAVVGEVAIHNVLVVSVHNDPLAQQDVSKLFKGLYNRE